jgi:hypothetical protein
MDLDNFVTGSLADRCLTLDHELTAHENFRTICIFMPVKEFTRDNAAEFLDLVDVPVNCLLENLIDNLKVPREVCPFKGAREVDIDIERGNKNDRAFLVPVHFYEFFHIFYTDSCKVDTDIGR